MLLSHPDVHRVETISRRTPTAATSEPLAKLTTTVEGDNSRWPSIISSLNPPPSILISSLGTTRGKAGGLKNQYKIDVDLNVNCAKAARDAGAKVYVLISSEGANPNSMLGYLKMKGECEEKVKELGFERTIILRPGLIVGHREESRPTEAIMRYFASGLGKIHSSLTDFWAQDVDVIARAAVHAGLKALKGDVPTGSEKVWVLSQSDIVRLGRTEWNKN